MDDFSSPPCSSARDDLSRLFNQISLWIIDYETMDEKLKFNWNELHLSLVARYVSSFFQSDILPLSYQNLFGDPLWYAMPGSGAKHAETVSFFTQELRVFFRVPRRHQLVNRGNSPIKENELLAAFINFLLQLLYHRNYFTHLLDDRVKTLERDLRFLLTVLGDTVVQYNEHEVLQIQNLLEEFEAVANEAGSLVHSFFFSIDPVFKIMEEELGVVLKHIGCLTDNVMKFLDLLPFITEAYITPNSSSVNSLLFVNSLLYELTDLVNGKNNDLIADVKDQLEILHHGLIFSLFCIQDIGGLRPSVIEELKEPLLRIGDVACEAENLINSFLVGDAPFMYFTTRLTHVIDKVEVIGTGLKEIKKKIDVGPSDVAKSFNGQAKTTCEVEDDEITVGFEDMTTDILDHLVGGTNQLRIISVFGMPGLGKTTLAKKLYNHMLVEYRFDQRIWCFVSQTYCKKSLLVEILGRLTSEIDEQMILNTDWEESLTERIYKCLKGRRYLIIMDDIWSSDVWYDLRRCFPDDGNGSRIVFTSRNKDVGPPSSVTYALPSLSDDQCWELLEKKVFRNKPCPSELIRTGRIIVANCFGLPLAVVVIAGILSTMDNEVSTWEKVGENLGSFIYSDSDNSMMQILELSYEHLSDHLKPCFLLFGVQRATKIPVRKLARLWIAEGFVRKKGRRSLESVAEEYLAELIDKSLVMVSERRSDGGIKTCVVHDLLRDLCLKRCKEENFVKQNHHSSIYVVGHRILLPEYSGGPFGQHVRSFHGYPPETPFYVANMKLLKVLNFHSKMHPPPHFIGTEFLVQLKYLVVADLPASIGSLVNLEFLTVMNSKQIVIPTAMVKMKKLRYVDFADLAIFDQDCNSSETNIIDFLSNVGIMNLKDEEMLKCSPHLSRLKCKCEPTFLAEQGVYCYPDFRFHTKLESLKMVTYGRLETAEIKLPANIKKLTLSGSRLPWDRMSIIGSLAKLEVLKLADNAFVGETWETRDGEFEQLVFLKLVRLNSLAEWIVPSSQHFPKLQKLILFACQNLGEIPSEVGEVAALRSIELIRCPESVEESGIKIRQEQRDMGNEELTVIIKNISPSFKS